MSKKLNILAVDAAHQAAAEAVTRANEALNALEARMQRDHRLALDLNTLYVLMRAALNPSLPSTRRMSDEFRAELEPVANSYGYTLTDHPVLRDNVVITKIGA